MFRADGLGFVQSPTRPWRSVCSCGHEISLDTNPAGSHMARHAIRKHGAAPASAGGEVPASNVSFWLVWSDEAEALSDSAIEDERLRLLTDADVGGLWQLDGVPMRLERAKAVLLAERWQPALAPAIRKRAEEDAFAVRPGRRRRVSTLAG